MTVIVTDPETLRRMVRDAVNDALRLHAAQSAPPKLDQATDSDELLTVAQVALELHVDQSTVRRWVRSGKLTSRRANRLCRVPRSALAEFLSDRPCVQGEQDPNVVALGILRGR